MKDFTGKFITFEGGEGAGKSTQIKLLGEYLTRKEVKTVLTREPGGTGLGEKIRGILLKKGERTALAELLLHQASRAQHLAEVIIPALKAGKFVLCDRFCDSSIAYQVFGSGLKEETALLISDIVAGSFKPDLTILLDVDPEIGLNRCNRQSSPDRYECQPLDFHKRVREGFLTIAEREPDRVFVLSAHESFERLEQDIRNKIAAAFF